MPLSEARRLVWAWSPGIPIPTKAASLGRWISGFVPRPRTESSVWSQHITASTTCLSSPPRVWRLSWTSPGTTTVTHGDCHGRPGACGATSTGRDRNADRHAAEDLRPQAETDANKPLQPRRPEASDPGSGDLADVTEKLRWLTDAPPPRRVADAQPDRAGSAAKPSACRSGRCSYGFCAMPAHTPLRPVNRGRRTRSQRPIPAITLSQRFLRQHAAVLLLKRGP